MPEILGFDLCQQKGVVALCVAIRNPLESHMLIADNIVAGIRHEPVPILFVRFVVIQDSGDDQPNIVARDEAIVTTRGCVFDFLGNVGRFELSDLSGVLAWTEKHVCRQT